MEEVVPEVVERRRWMSGILALIGGVIVLGVMFNLSTIEEGLVEILAGSTGPQLGLWNGEDGEMLTRLAAELTTRPLADDLFQETLLSPSQVNNYAGRYVLAVQDQVEGLLPIGEAVVRRDGDTFYFVGRTGTTEVRGKANVNNNGFLVATWGSAGYRLGSDEFQVRGAAGRNEGGGLDCYGEVEGHETSYDFFAYQVAPAADE